MDRSVAHVVRTDVPPDLRRTALVTMTAVAFVWTGALEALVRANADALRTRRLAIVLWVGAALWIVAAWRQIRTKP
jgi:hypothetical protein